MSRLAEAVESIVKARFVFTCGNGGSAATAEHLTNDLFSKGIRAMCLNSNTSIMTMIANDFGYEHVFSKQLAIYGTPEDLLVTLSCSGSSPNIIRAHHMAFSLGMKVHPFEVFGRDRDYGKLEDQHLQLVHRIKDAL